MIVEPPPAIIKLFNTNWINWITRFYQELHNRKDLLVKSNTLANTDTTAKDLFVIEKDSQLIDLITDVTTAFDGGGTNLIDLGKSGAANHFADNLAAGAIARVLGSSDASQIPNYQNIGTTDVTVQGIYIDGNADSTAGAATITMLYVRGHGL